MEFVFDLDGTLYSRLDHVWEKISEQLHVYFVKTLQLPVTWSPEEQIHLKAKWHTQQTVVAYMNEFGLEFDVLVEATHLPVVDLLNIEARPGLERIAELPGKKWILTNSPESFAQAILTRLQIEKVFEGIYGIRSDITCAKPAQDSYLRIPVSSGAQIIMVEDCADNLIIPHQFGWKTVWIPEAHHPFPTEQPEHVHHIITSLEELHFLP